MAIVTVIEVRFPALAEEIQQKVERVKKPETLRQLLKGMRLASSEDAARLLLDVLTA